MSNKNNTKKNDEQETERYRALAVKNWKGEELVCFWVNNDALSDFGVDEGDALIVKVTNRLDENRITVWDTPDGQTAKFAYENFGDITLYNKKDWLKSYPAKDIKMLGVAVCVQKTLEAVK